MNGIKNQEERLKYQDHCIELRDLVEIEARKLL